MWATPSVASRNTKNILNSEAVAPSSVPSIVGGGAMGTDGNYNRPMDVRYRVVWTTASGSTGSSLGPRPGSVLVRPVVIQLRGRLVQRTRDAPQVSARDVGIDLRGADARVPQ